MSPIKKKKLLPKIISIGDLRYKCNNDSEHEKYASLACIAARNLGLTGSLPTVDQSIRWLETNAMETNEDGVVDEINFCRDLVK